MEKFTVQNSCLLCRKKFEWDQKIQIRTPSGACFCMPCIYNPKYWGDTTCEGDYESWITIEYRGPELFQWMDENEVLK